MKKNSASLAYILSIVSGLLLFFWLMWELTQRTHMSTSTAYVFAFIVLCIGGVLQIYIKIQKNTASWTGVITDKIANQVLIKTPPEGDTEEDIIKASNYVPGPSTTMPKSTFTLKVKTDKGKNTHIQVNGPFYLKVNVGDMITKIAGTEEPLLEREQPAKSKPENSATPSI